MKKKMGVDEKNKTSQKFQKSYFDVLGLCCSSEVALIEKLLKPLDGVKDVSIIVPSRTVIVLHDSNIISQVQIVKALNQARLEANVRVVGDAVDYRKKWPSPYAIGCGVLLLLSFLKYVYRPLEWLALAAVAVGIFPIFLKGIAALWNFTLDTNILALFAVVGSIALHDYWEAGAIVFLFTIAQWLESRASHKATAVMSSLMNIVPQKAILAESGEEVDAEEVKVGSILAVKAGETIAVDGMVVEGSCEVDEKALTGESFPVSKQTGSTVWAGTINLNGYISVRTTALAEDCVVAKMAKLVEDAQNSKSKTQRFIDKCAKFYTPAVVLISIGLAAIPAILRVDNQNRWFHLALVVLVCACPCGLILSTPVATFCALSKAAIAGVLIKGGEYLETLAKIKIIGFDKTGTITRGEFVVTRFQSLSDDFSLNTLLYWVSSIESKSSHPMAAALIDYARSRSIEPESQKVEEFENFPGEGIHGKIDGNDVYLGNTKIALRAKCAAVPSLEDYSKDGKSIGYIFLGAAPAGFFTLSDACRTGVKEAITELKSMGIKTAMLTGDSHEAAALAQAQVLDSLNVVHAELLPQDKARIIKDFQKEAPTAMVGDGLNDAPALATADIGISMGISGSALATETGNIILMSNDIRKIPKTIRLAKRAHRKVIQNVVLSILTKTAILGLAVAGYPLVWAAVLADLGTCLVVISNSMLLLRENEKRITKCCESSTKRVRACQSGTFGLGSCHNQKKSNTTGTNGCCAHEDRIKETKHSDDHCNSGPSMPSSCVKRHCTKFDGCHNICASDDGAKPFDQSVAKTGCHGSNHETLFRDNCSGSGHNRKSSNAAEANGCCAHEDQIKETKHSDDHCNSGPSMPSSCVKNHCTKFDGCHNICASDDGAKPFDQSVAKTGCHGSNHETLFRDKCSGSGHNRKSSNAAEANGCCAHEDQIKETKHSDDHCNSGPSMPSSCVKNHCTKFDGCHNICASDDGAKLFDQSVAKTGCHSSNHETLFRDNCSGLGHNRKSSNTARTNGCCAHENGIKDATHSDDRRMGSNDVGFVGSHETLFIDNCSLLKATGDGSSGRNDGGCEGITKTCVNLEKREISGCCKSYKKECCGTSGYFGDSFRVGLSGIVIE